MVPIYKSEAIFWKEDGFHDWLSNLQTHSIRWKMICRYFALALDDDGGNIMYVYAALSSNCAKLGCSLEYENDILYIQPHDNKYNLSNLQFVYFSFVLREIVMLHQ